MAAEEPRPGRSGGPGPGVDDHTLWTVLRAVVAHRPPLPAALVLIDPTSHSIIERRIGATVRDVLDFAGKIEVILALPGVPDGPGRARAVARLVVRMCWDFTRRWTRDRPVTSRLLADFEREVDLVDTALDAIATRSATQTHQPPAVWLQELSEADPSQTGFEPPY